MKSGQQKIKGLILDMDGVLWRDTEPIGDLPTLFQKISDQGWKTAFVTNNATRSVSQYVEKFASFGVATEEDQIINSGLATALYLRKRFPLGGQVYVIGEVGFLHTLSDHGYEDSIDDPLAVVVSLDRNLTYNKLSLATGFVRSGLPFVGTNPDPALPTPSGYIPGTGSILAAIEAATGCEPAIIGKPSPSMYQIAIDNLGFQPEKVLAVGDQMGTDIAAGIAAGCLTGLVLTGVSDENAVDDFPFKPTYVAQSLTDLINELS